MSGAFFYLWAFTLLIIDSVFPSQEKQSLGPYTNDSTIKNTRFGWVKGTLLPTKSDSVRGVLQFLNIPYAEPPVAELRYSDPVDWTAPYPRPYYNATRVGVQCRQQQYSGKRSFLTVGVEDCLYLNIWTPYLRNKSDVSFNFTDTNSTTALPVLFFIHGGDFIEGNGDQVSGSICINLCLFLTSVDHEIVFDIFCSKCSNERFTCKLITLLLNYIALPGKFTSTMVLCSLQNIRLWL